MINNMIRLFLQDIQTSYSVQQSNYALLERAIKKLDKKTTIANEKVRIHNANHQVLAIQKKFSVVYDRDIIPVSIY